MAPDKCDRGEPQPDRVWREMALREISAKTGACASVLALLEMVDLL